MKELSRKMMDYSRLGLTLLVLGILVSAVGGSVEQVAADLDPSSAETTVSVYTAESMRAVEIDPDEEAESPVGNMNGSGTTRLPSHSQHLTPVILPLQDKTESRIRQTPIQPSIEVPRPVLVIRQERTQTSPCLIDSHLGRQFTLVGAYPSGTS